LLQHRNRQSQVKRKAWTTKQSFMYHRGPNYQLTPYRL